MTISQETADSAKILIERLYTQCGLPEKIENHEGVALYYRQFKVDIEDTDFAVYCSNDCQFFESLENCVIYILETAGVSHEQG